jgi:MYXO-CTERM domain-containing protein
VTSPALVTRLAASYVVTAGAGWRSAEPHLCNGDVSSPIFRGGSAAVAGVTANYTTYAGGKLPVTIHHTRVDAMSRFKIGDWLSGLGVATMHSCSEAAGGCVKHSYDGGAPMGPTTDTQGDGTPQPGDAGTSDAIAPESDASTTAADGGTSADPPVSAEPHSDQLPTEDTSSADPTGDEDYSDAAAPTKKKKAAAGGCSTAPGAPAPTGEMFLALGVVLGAAVIRRRRK